MLKSVEAIISAKGEVRLNEPLQLDHVCRAIVTILEDDMDVTDTAVLSEESLARDWNRPEEDSAWSHLQQAM